MTQHIEDLKFIHDSLIAQFEAIEESTDLDITDRKRDLTTNNFRRIDFQTKDKWNTIRRSVRHVLLQINEAEKITKLSDDPDIEYESHESYGMLQLTAPTGQGNLFGSTVKHQHYLSLTISRAEIKRDLNTDWVHPTEELIVVNLSHAQWGKFLSSTGSTGVPCTITRYLSRGMERPTFVNKRSQFTKEFQADMAKIAEELRVIQGDMVDKLNSRDTLKRGDRTEMAKRLDKLTSALTSRLGFVARCWDESIEGSISEAKIEVETYINSIIQQAGLSSIENKADQILTLGSSEDNK